jgi:hypothetical protein
MVTAKPIRAGERADAENGPDLNEGEWKMKRLYLASVLLLFAAPPLNFDAGLEAPAAPCR